MQPILPTVMTPIVFSNGDDMPLTSSMWTRLLTGWIDFEHARFEDPYIGFAKFLLWANDEYGWGAGAKAGLVERYLYVHDVTSAEFLIRLVLRGLWHIQGDDPAAPPEYMLRVLANAVTRLRHAIR